MDFDTTPPKQTVKYKRKSGAVLKQPFFFTGTKRGRQIEGTSLHVQGMFITQQEALDDSAISTINKPKYKGRGPGTYKHKRDIIRKSRRDNRGK